MSPNGNIMLLIEPKDLGKVIRTRRRALGLTQSRLASSAIVGRQWLVELEKGKTRAPLDLVIKVLGILGYALQLSDIGPPQAMLSPRLSPTGFKADRKGKGVAARQVGMTTVKHPLLTKGEGRKIQRPEDPPDGKALRGSYEVADLKAVGIALDRERLYDPEYRQLLTRLVAKVVETEGPVFEELVARRIARAHQLARATSKLAQVVTVIAKENFPSTEEGDRRIIWPEDPDSLTLPPFRSDSLGLRDHADVPLVELAALAAGFLSRGYSSEQTIVFMTKELGLSRVTSATRARLVQAIELAYAHLPSARE